MKKPKPQLKKMTLRQLYKLRESLDAESWRVQKVIIQKERETYPEAKVH